MKFLILFALLINTNYIFSQDDIQKNYKKIAQCEETIVDGKLFHTFGEGPCPPGSKKRYGQKRYACPSGNTHNSLECANQRMDDINAAFGAAQDALLALGQQWSDKLSKQALERMSKHNEMIVDNSYTEISDDNKYKEITIVEPNNSEEHEAFVGESLISIKSGYYSDCVIPHFDVEMKKIGGWTMFIKKDIPVCKLIKFKRHIKEKFYYPPYWNQISSDPKISPYSLPFKITEKKKGFTMCQTAMGMSAGCGKNKTNDEISFKTGYVVDNDLPYKHLVYMEKYGNILKFNFITNDQVKEIFINDTDSELSIGGAIIKILEVTDSSIKYNILESFNN